MRPSSAADYGYALNLDQQAGSREAADGNERASRKAFLECLLADLGQAIPVPYVGNKDRHGDQVFQPAAADRLDGLVQRVENFACLIFKTGVWRAGLPAQPDCLAPFRSDGARKGPLLRARIGRVALFGAAGGRPQSYQDGGSDDD